MLKGLVVLTRTPLIHVLAHLFSFLETTVCGWAASPIDLIGAGVLRGLWAAVETPAGSATRGRLRASAVFFTVVSGFIALQSPGQVILTISADATFLLGLERVYQS